jgi:AcrR family transcriptional regulator
MADKEERKKRITARRQEQILHAAMDVFSRKGYTAATIPDIARSAGLAVGTIYLYFPNKRELFVAVIRGLMTLPLVKIFESEADRDFLNTIQGALRNRFQMLQSERLPELLSLMGEIQHDPELEKLFYHKLLRPFLKKMEEMYAARVKAGEIRQIDPAIAVRIIGGMMIGMFLLKGLEGESSPFNRLPQEQLAQEVMNFVLHGLINEPNKETPDG